jgi:predicted butyrate kinase (DUF1464 family)
MRKAIKVIGSEVLRGLFWATVLFTVFYIPALHETAAAENRRALERELRSAKMQVTQYKYKAKRAENYAAVIAHAANGGSFKVGNDILVNCAQIAFPEGTGLIEYNAVH